MMKKPNRINTTIADDILQDYSDLENRLFMTLKRHITWEEYIRIRSNNPNIYALLDTKIKELVK